MQDLSLDSPTEWHITEGMLFLEESWKPSRAFKQNPVVDCNNKPNFCVGRRTIDDTHTYRVTDQL